MRLLPKHVLYIVALCGALHQARINIAFHFVFLVCNSCTTLFFGSFALSMLGHGPLRDWNAAPCVGAKTFPQHGSSFSCPDPA